MLIDAHCHLQADTLQAQLETILAVSAQRGITIHVVNGTCEADWPKVADLARQYPGIRPSFGLHPWKIKDRSENWLQNLSTFLEEFPDAGVGEIGLDRWVADYDLEDQKTVLAQQWQLAAEFNRPVTVHCLKAWGALDSMLDRLPPLAFLLHSYSGPKEMVASMAKRGAYFSISGYFLRAEKSAKLIPFEVVPNERLLLETDAPEMRPPAEFDVFPEAAFNHPANLHQLYQQVSQLKGTNISTQVAHNFTQWWTKNGSDRLA